MVLGCERIGLIALLLIDESSAKLVSISGGVGVVSMVGVGEFRKSAVAKAMLSLMLVSMVSTVDERIEDWMVELMDASSWNSSKLSADSFLISKSSSFGFSNSSSFTSRFFNDSNTTLDSSFIPKSSQQLDFSSTSFSCFSLMEKGGIRGVGTRVGGSKITYNYF